MATNETKVVITAEDKTRQAFASASAGLQKLSDTANAVGFGGIATGLAALTGGAALSSMVQQTIAMAAALDDMAEKTGASVENLSGLASVAKISGVQLQEVESGLIRLSKALAGADEESKGAGKAFAQLGLDPEKLRAADSADALKQVADAFGQFADGTGKTSAALAIFGKQGAQLLPFLKDLAETGELQAKVTTQQAAAAEELEKSWRRVTATGGSVAKQIVMDLLPAFAFGVDAVQGFIIVVKQLGSSLAVIANDVITAAKIIGVGVTAGLTEEGQNKIKALLAERSRFVEAANEDLNARLASFKSTQDKVNAILEGKGIDKKPTLNFTLRDPKAAKTGAVAKAGFVEPSFLSNDAKDIEDILKRNADLQKSLQSLDDEFEKIGRKRDRDFALSGLTEGARALQQDLDAIEEKAVAAKIKLIEAFDGNYSQGFFDALTRIDAAQKAAAESAEKNAAALAKQNEQWEVGATRALANYAEQVRNVARFTEDAVTRAFRGMEDALVNFVKTGKLDFKSLADSIISDLIRIQVQQSITKPLAQAGTNLLGRLFGSSGGGFDASGFGSSFGSGGGFSVPSFAGGGETGFGARSGGLDGMGGFLAMLHPNETVIDRTAGIPTLAGAGGQQFNFQIDARGADIGVEQRIAAAVRQAVSMSVAAVQQQADRGGNYAKSLGRR